MSNSIQSPRWWLGAGVAVVVVAGLVVAYALHSGAPDKPADQLPVLQGKVFADAVWAPTCQPWLDLSSASLHSMVPEGMVWVPGGEYWMGDDAKLPDGNALFFDASPHLVRVDGFWIDRTEVTNAQFARFVKETGYVTVAERTPKLEDFPEQLRPHIKKEMLVPGSIVFQPTKEDVPLDRFRSWQHYTPGACWKRPEGPGSDLEGRDSHPVVQVCWDDAVAYCKWARKRLPTEAEWEFAARGGLDRKPHVWGDDLPGKDGKWQANIWQGKFPRENTKEDGHFRTAPAGSFPANGFGLHDMSGNVWEWCSDWYRPDYYQKSPVRNPQGPSDSYDPTDPNDPTQPKRAMRGGSFLCSDQYCVRYRPGGRGKGAPDSGGSNVGFRCVLSK